MRAIFSEVMPKRAAASRQPATADPTSVAMVRVSFSVIPNIGAIWKAVEGCCSIKLVDGEGMDTGLHVGRHGVEIVGWCEPPAIWITKEAVVAQMVVRVGYQHIEHDPRPKLACDDPPAGRNAGP